MPSLPIDLSDDEDDFQPVLPTKTRPTQPSTTKNGTNNSGNASSSSTGRNTKPKKPSSYTSQSQASKKSNIDNVKSTTTTSSRTKKPTQPIVMKPSLSRSSSAVKDAAPAASGDRQSLARQSPQLINLDSDNGSTPVPETTSISQRIHEGQELVSEPLPTTTTTIAAAPKSSIAPTPPRKSSYSRKLNSSPKIQSPPVEVRPPLPTTVVDSPITRCPLCNRSLSGSADAIQIHINGCLDGSSTSSSKPIDNHSASTLVCMCCGRDLTDEIVLHRQMHMNTCLDMIIMDPLDVDPTGKNKGKAVAEPICSETSPISLLAFCPCCNSDWDKEAAKSVKGKMTHIKQCGKTNFLETAEVIQKIRAAVAQMANDGTYTSGKVVPKPAPKQSKLSLDYRRLVITEGDDDFKESRALVPKSHGIKRRKADEDLQVAIALSKSAAEAQKIESGQSIGGRKKKIKRDGSHLMTAEQTTSDVRIRAARILSESKTLERSISVDSATSGSRLWDLAHVSGFVKPETFTNVVLQEGDEPELKPDIKSEIKRINEEHTIVVAEREQNLERQIATLRDGHQRWLDNATFARDKRLEYLRRTAYQTWTDVSPSKLPTLLSQQTPPGAHITSATQAKINSLLDEFSDDEDLKVEPENPSDEDRDMAVPVVPNIGQVDTINARHDSDIVMVDDFYGRAENEAHVGVLDDIGYQNDEGGRNIVNAGMETDDRNIDDTALRNLAVTPPADDDTEFRDLGVLRGLAVTPPAYDDLAVTPPAYDGDDEVVADTPPHDSYSYHDSYDELSGMLQYSPSPPRLPASLNSTDVKYGTEDVSTMLASPSTSENGIATLLAPWNRPSTQSTRKTTIVPVDDGSDDDIIDLTGRNKPLLLCPTTSHIDSGANDNIDIDLTKDVETAPSQRFSSQSVQPSQSQKRKASAEIDASDKSKQTRLGIDTTTASSSTTLPTSTIPPVIQPSGMPSYESMSMDELRKIASKFGFRATSKAPLVAHLTRMWLVLNGFGSPIATPGTGFIQVEPPIRINALLAAAAAASNGAKRNKRKAVAAKKGQQYESDDDDDEDDDDEEVEKGSKFDPALGSKLLDVFETDLDLYMRVLRYEPLNLDEFHARVSQVEKITCSKKKLSLYLDQQGINYIIPPSKKTRREPPPPRKDGAPAPRRWWTK
ncbi:hypothetical protein SmJEL517_g01113 [Synchytrium microbalum]|uniref:Structure-specific endonuclease subunit SLX4 n=1 Tax=Synchytrium microbalum TaxID=1806994 RepID=A0A507C7A6_9FUNG|nr:uncharacterized protein SmJEL517_g01113 [Synchytrium microbalum]TPX36927.1 hypothetical protein SmJEL517_g01113 [Synchytrium microbalum]